MGLDAELLERRRDVEVMGILQPQSLLLKHQPVEVASAAIHRVQVRRREHERHRA